MWLGHKTDSPHSGIVLPAPCTGIFGDRLQLTPDSAASAYHQCGNRPGKQVGQADAVDDDVKGFHKGGSSPGYTGRHTGTSCLGISAGRGAGPTQVLIQ